MLKKLKLNGSSGRSFRPKKDVHFIAGDWNAKVRRVEIPGAPGKFGLEVQNEADED